MPKPSGVIPQIPALSATPSGNPPAGFELLYFKSSDGNLYRKDSGGSETVVGSGGGSTEPAGVIKPFGGVVTPSGYLDCDGSAVSRTTYATLWAAVSFEFTGNNTSGQNTITAIAMSRGALANIMVGMPISGTGIPAGTTVSAVNTGTSTITLSATTTAGTTGGTYNVAPFGVGDGSTTFNVPDAQGRMLLGEASNLAQGASDAVPEAQRAAGHNHVHAHTASSGSSSDSAGTPAGTLSSVSAGTPAGTLSSVSAGTPAGTLSSDSAGTPAGTLSSVSVGAPTGSLDSAVLTPSVVNGESGAGGHSHTISGQASGTNWLTANTGAKSVPSQALFDGHAHGGNTGSVGNHTHGASTSVSIPDHTHTFTGTVFASHSHTFTGSALGTHGHTFTGSALAGHSHTFTGSALGTHTHAFTGSALSTHGHTITTTVNNVSAFFHPYVVVAYIIKT